LNFLIDTNVVSQTRKDKPVAEVMQWWKKYSSSVMGISVITVYELRYGIQITPSGSKRDGLERWMEHFLLPVFAGRILPVDAAVADTCGRLIAICKKGGHTPDLADALIAATAKVHRLHVVTLNRKHFEPLRVDLAEF
jgi:predicted nucleic acid-binding protein